MFKNGKNKKKKKNTSKASELELYEEWTQTLPLLPVGESVQISSAATPKYLKCSKCSAPQAQVQRET